MNLHRISPARGTRAAAPRVPRAAPELPRPGAARGTGAAQTCAGAKSRVPPRHPGCRARLPRRHPGCRARVPRRHLGSRRTIPYLRNHIRDTASYLFPETSKKGLRNGLKRLTYYFRQNSLTSGKKPVPRGECPRRSHLPGVSPGADGACLWQPVWGITCVARACRGERRCLPPPDNSSESLNIECYRLLRLQSRLQTTRVNRNRRESAGCFCNVPGLLQGSSRVSPGFTPFPDIEALPGSDISRYALFTPDRQR